MKKLLEITAFCCVIISLMGCPAWTDVPVSESTTLPDPRVLGIWQHDEDAIAFVKQGDGSISMLQYSYNDSLLHFENNDTSEKLGWANLKHDREKLLFVSAKTFGSYTTFNCLLSDNDHLIVRFVDDELCKKYQIQQDTNEIWMFKTPKQYQAFLKQHLSDPLMFDVEEQDTFVRRKTMFDLVKPQ